MGTMGKAISLRVRSQRAQAPKVVKQIGTPRSSDPIMRRPTRRPRREARNSRERDTSRWQGKKQEQLDFTNPNQRGLLVQAYIWLDLSALHGSQRALQLQDTIIQEMTPTQLAEARKLARTHAVPKGGI